MKKILFLITVLIGSFSVAQQEITPAQQELSKQTSADIQEFNSKIEAKVDQIMEITQLDLKKRSELTETVATKESLLARLDREGTDADDYQGRRNDIINGYQEKMERLLGATKFNLLQSKLSPK